MLWSDQSAHLNLPDNRCLILTRARQIVPIMTPLDIPHLVRMPFQYQRRYPRERRLVALVVGIQRKGLGRQW